MDELDDPLEDARVCLGEDAVAQVEDVTGCGPARSRTSRVSAAATSQVVRHMAGSRLPCTATPGPTRCRASSSGTRQSTPTTELPAVAIEAKSSPVPTPNRMVGTPGWESASSAKSLVVAGSTSSS